MVEGIARKRACAVSAPWWRGSGTMIGEAMVLTSGQVRAPEPADGAGPDGTNPVGSTAAPVEIHASTHLDNLTIEAKRIWDSPDGYAALLRLVGLSPALRRLPLGGSRHLVAGARADIYGFRHPGGPGAQPVATHLTGTVSPVSQAGAGWFDLAVDAGVSEIEPGQTLPWSGLAGAGVFHDDRLVGVVVPVAGAYASRRLSAFPVARLLDEPGFRDAT